MIRSWSTVKKAGVALAALALVASPTAGASAAPTVAGTTDLRQLRGTVTIDGSSTVFPISEAMAEEFQKATSGNVRVTVGISGTGGGFKKFCAGETDISDASRPILKRRDRAVQADRHRVHRAARSRSTASRSW